MKFLKLTLMVLLIAFLGLLVYANVRPFNPSEKLPMVSMSQFTVTPIKDSIQFDRVTKAIDEIQGVNACSMSPNSPTVAIMYQTEKTDPEVLKNALSDGGKIAVTENDLSQCAKRSCPVTGPMARVDAAIAALNFRN